MTYLEKTNFHDLILSIGNVEIFLYIIDLLTMHTLNNNSSISIAVARGYSNTNEEGMIALSDE